jgi:hypothetical protein
MTGRLLRRPPNNSPPRHRNHASYNRAKKDSLLVPQPRGKWGTNDGLCPLLFILARRMRRIADLHEVEGLLVHQPLTLRE